MREEPPPSLQVEETSQLDEIRLSAGLALDQTTGTVIRRPAIPLAVATHGLFFMLGRAFEQTGNLFSSASIRESSIGIIQECEKIGVRIMLSLATWLVET